MTLEQIGRRVRGLHPGVRLVLALIAAGVMVEMLAMAVGIGLAISVGDHFEHSKAFRDAAEAGSGTLSQLGTIKAVSTWLEPLKIVGVAVLFTGIAAALAVIIPNIQLRGQAMAVALPRALAARSDSEEVN
jgi:hypothetical protein